MNNKRTLLWSAVAGGLSTSAGALGRAILGKDSLFDFYVGGFVLEFLPSVARSGATFNPERNAVIAIAGLAMIGLTGALLGAALGLVLRLMTERLWIHILVVLVFSIAIQLIFGDQVFIG